LYFGEYSLGSILIWMRTRCTPIQPRFHYLPNKYLTYLIQIETLETISGLLPPVNLNLNCKFMMIIIFFCIAVSTEPFSFFVRKFTYLAKFYNKCRNFVATRIWTLTVRNPYPGGQFICQLLNQLRLFPPPLKRPARV
jgi:hypothetical protein